MMAPWDRTKGRPEPIRALNRIREVENGEPLVDIRTVSPSVLVGRETVIPYLRKTVAEMLERAARRIPDGWQIAVIDAWRPFARQQRIYDWLMACAREAFPHRDHAALRRTVCRFVAPTDQKAPPGHCTGGAVDVELRTPDGEVVDVWSPYTRFTAARTYTIGLDPEPARARSTLVESMLAEGFSNCRDEWWHYSYGDAGWAMRVGEPECPYGLVELDPALYAEQERLSEEAFKERKNPWIPEPEDT